VDSTYFGLISAGLLLLLARPPRSLAGSNSHPITRWFVVCHSQLGFGHSTVSLLSALSQAESADLRYTLCRSWKRSRAR